MYTYPIADDYGFYTVGDFKTYSKIEAIEISQLKNQFPHWHFNNDIFGQLNWTDEPSFSISELYQQRAVQLRLAYDYIIIMFSGGWDSTNIVQSFIDANVYPDELFTFYQEDDISSEQYFEIKNYTFPRMELIAKKYPQIKLRRFESKDFYSQGIHDVDNPLNNKDFIYLYNSIMGPNKILQDHLPKLIPSWKKLIESGKKVALVYGIDKPRVRYNNKWIFSFQDNAFSELSPQYQKTGGIGEYREFFYWSPNAPLIPLKQAHLVKNYCSKINWTKDKNIANSFGTPVPLNLVSRAIYQDIKLFNNFYESKPVIYTLGQRDWNFDKDANNINLEFNRIKQHLQNTIPNDWQNHGGFIKKGLVGNIVDYCLN
jgi:hypothetical protein